MRQTTVDDDRGNYVRARASVSALEATPQIWPKFLNFENHPMNIEDNKIDDSRQVTADER
jgi:hypothetical protein